MGGPGNISQLVWAVLECPCLCSDDHDSWLVSRTSSPLSYLATCAPPLVLIRGNQPYQNITANFIPSFQRPSPPASKLIQGTVHECHKVDCPPSNRDNDIKPWRLFHDKTRPCFAIVSSLLTYRSLFPVEL